MIKMRYIIGALLSTLITMGDACTPDYSAAQQESRRQEQSSQRGLQIVGQPAITQFSEKKILKMIYELRDKMAPTITYNQDMNGHLHVLCDSLGYGIDGATQFTSPEQDIWVTTQSQYHMAMPQADPNGLYSPAASEGTWVLCLDPTTKQLAPVRAEPQMITSPFAFPQAIDDRPVKPTSTK